MAVSFPNFVANTSWQDIVANSTFSSISNQYLSIQNLDPISTVQVYFGGNTAPSSSNYGGKIVYLDSVEGSANNIWIKAGQSNTEVTILIND